MLTERDFKKIRALKRRRMTEKAMREDEVQDGDEPAIMIPKMNILEYAEKKKLYKRFLEDPNNMATRDLEKIQDMDQEELMEIISDNENSYDSLEEEEESDDEEEVDVDELDSDEFEELDADEEVMEFDSEEDEEGDSDDEECPSLIEMDGEEEEEGSDIEEIDDENLGKRKAPKSILKKAKPEKKLKTENGDGPESTVNSECSDTENELDDESSDLELSDDDGFNKERRSLGFMAEEDIYTHKLTRAEQRRREKEGFEEIAKVKKTKFLIEERGRKTNKTKELNKPFMMTVAKKVRKVDSYKQLRVRNKQMKVQ
jgi:hypothetical protein